MAKLTLNDITGGVGSSTLHNANYALIEAALENTLSRDGTSPNQMEADLDMNSYDVNNADRVYVQRLFIKGNEYSGVLQIPELDQINDVDLTDAVDTNFIRYNGTDWVDYDLYAANETITGNWTFTGTFNIGDPGFESGSVQLNDALYDAVAKINEFGGANDAALILHRHDSSASVPANILFSKTNSEDQTHGDVSDNELLGRMLFAGWNTDTYNWGSSIFSRVDGTPGATAMPSELVFATSGAASRIPTERMRIRADGTVEIEDELFLGANGGGDSVLSFYDDTNNTWRSIFWDDSEGAFFFEDSTGVFQQFGTGSGGGGGPDLLLGGM